MAITTTVPTIIPPTSQVTCDKVWIEQQVINAPVEGGAVSAILVCRPYYEDEEGNKTFAPANQQRTYRVADVYALAATNEAVATALETNIAGSQAIIALAEASQQGQEGQ